MNQTIPLTEHQTGVNATDTAATAPLKPAALRDIARATLREYFIRLEGQQPTNLYELVLAEVESPLLEMVLQYTGQNQSAAAKLLNISRGTLRKKMQQYGYLNPRKKRNV
jgi:Fis family transcriptional regulator, factor for inversion stimulation protein